MDDASLLLTLPLVLGLWNELRLSFAVRLESSPRACHLRNIPLGHIRCKLRRDADRILPHNRR
jgi:hypothetical protein